MRRHQLGRSLEQQRHPLARAHALRQQALRDGIRPGVERGVADAAVEMHQRRRVRLGGGALFEQGVHGLLRRPGPRGRVPGAQQLFALCGVEHRQRGDAARRVGCQRVQQIQPVRLKLLRGAGVEQVGVVFEQRFERVTALLQLQRQVEFRKRLVEVDAPGAYVAPRCQLGVGRLQHDHRLDQWRAAGLARQLQRVDHFLERHVLVVDGTERRGLDLFEQLGHRHRVVEVAAQRERVGEEADHVGEVVAVAVCDHRAGDDGGLAAVAVQQRLPSGEQQHEQGGVVALREVAQRFEAVERDVLAMARATEARLGAAAPVGRQFERARRAGEGARPVGDFAFTHAAGQPDRFPRRIVGVAQRRVAQARHTAAAAGGVERAEFAQEHFDGPAVAHAVMQRPQQPVLVGVEPHQGGTHRQFARRVDSALRLIGADALELALAFGGITVRAQVDARERAIVRRLHLLHQFTVDRDPAAAQHGVALQQVVQAGLQRAGVERSPQRQREWHVVERHPRGELLPKRHPALRGRKRQRCQVLFPSQRHERLRCTRRQRAGRAGGRAGVGERCVDQRRDRTQARLAEHARRRQRDAEAGFDGLQQAKRRQRIEPVFDQRRLGAECAGGAPREPGDGGDELIEQHRGAPARIGHRAQLGRQARRQHRTVVARRRRLGDVEPQRLQPALEVFLLAALAPDLAARRARYRAGADQRHRVHRQVVFLRHRAADVAHQRGQVSVGCAALDFLHHHERFAVVAGDRERGAISGAQHRVATLHGPFNVLRRMVAAVHDHQVFQAAADVELGVADEAKVAGAQPGAVALRRAGAEDVFADIAAPPVALADAAAANPDFADAIGRTRLPRLRVDDAHAHVGNRLAAADDAPGPRAGRAAVAHDAAFELLRVQAQHHRRGARGGDGDAEHRLGHAVGGREQRGARAVRGECGMELRRRVGVDRLRAAGARQQRAQVGGPVGLLRERVDAGHVSEVGRAGVGGTVARDRLQPAQRPAQEAERRHQVTRHAGVEWHQRAEHQAVVVEVRQPAQQPAGTRADVPAGRERAALVEQIRVRDDHAARRRRGARRVLQVGHGVGTERGAGGVRRRGARGGARGRLGHGNVARNPGRAGAAVFVAKTARRLEQVGDRQHQGGLRVDDDGAQTRRVVLEAHRVRRGHRHRDPTAHHAGPERAHELQPRRVDEQHPVARVRVARNQRGERVDLLLELRIRH